jgi:hypothetical protein
MQMEFDKTGLNEKDAETVDLVNSTLARLRNRRKDKVIRTGPFLKSKLAWKVANYQQAVLYRIVMLADGCVLTWNSNNPLCSFLAARALLETTALFSEFEHRLNELIEIPDFGGIDALAMNRTFATRDEPFAQSNPDLEAISVLTFIDKIDKRLLPGMRRHYDLLSERCHPNSFGHFFFFSTLDTETGTTTFADNKNKEGNFHHIIAPMILIGLVENSMGRLDEMIIKLADIHSAAHPRAKP